MEREEVEGWAKEMFAAYNREGPNPGKTWDGKDVPAWEACGSQVQGKWKAAARWALSHTAQLPEYRLAVGQPSP